MATTDYELILMLDPQVEDSRRDELAAETKARLESKGTLTHEANWGLRKMAYEIQRRTESDYRCYRFNGGKDLLDDLNHNLRITDGVLRFRIFRVDPESPTTEPPDTEQIMRRDEEDDRGRGRGGGRGRRDDRGPRRPRDEDAGEERSAPAAAPAAPSTEPAARAEPAAASEPTPAGEPESA